MRRLLTLTLVLLALVSIAAAAQETQVEPEASKATFPGRIVNFVLLFGGLGVLMRKPLAAFFKAQAKAVADALQGAADRRREAEERSRATGERLGAVAGETDALRKGAAGDAARERERIGRQAAEDSKRLREASAREIEQNLQAALRHLRAHAAEKATALAAERLKGRLTETDHRRLIARSIDRLSEAHADRPDAR